MSKLKYYDGTNWKVVNGQITGDTLPIGSIIPFGGETAPSGWLLCWGQELSRASYPELYSVIGDAFGGDDGDLTFNLPDLRGRTIVGKNLADTDFDTIGETGGEKKHTLTIDEMPSHNHNLNNSIVTFAQQGTIALSNTGGNNSTAYYYNAISQGGGQPHNIVQPYQVTNYIIKYKNAVGLVGNVLDSSSNSHTDSYSCDYINNAVLDNYSTNEQIIGTWFGKTLYKMSFQKTGNLTNISTGITDLDEVIDLKVNVKSSSGGQWRTVPWIYNANNYDNTFAGGAYVTSTGATIGFQAGTNLSAATKYNATILYTKTTD